MSRKWKTKKERKERYLRMIEDLKYKLSGGFSNKIIFETELDTIRLYHLQNVTNFAIEVIEAYKADFYEVYKNINDEFLSIEIQFHKRPYNRIPFTIGDE